MKSRIARSLLGFSGSMSRDSIQWKTWYDAVPIGDFSRNGHQQPTTATTVTHKFRARSLGSSFWTPASTTRSRDRPTSKRLRGPDFHYGHGCSGPGEGAVIIETTSSGESPRPSSATQGRIWVSTTAPTQSGSSTGQAAGGCRWGHCLLNNRLGRRSTRW